MDNNLKTTLTKFRQANDQRYKNGRVIVGKSLQTKSIEAVSEESGSVQDTPFINQGTGTANGTSIVDTSHVGKHVEKQGNNVAVNQIVRNGNFSDNSYWTNGRCSRSVSNNSCTITSDASANFMQLIQDLVAPLNTTHFYLAKYYYDFSGGSNVVQTSFVYTDTSNYITIGQNTTNKGTNFVVFKPTISATRVQFAFGGVSNLTNSDIAILKNIILVDLTQWFNGDIPQDLLDHPEHWSWYQNYGDYIAYNTGSLENADGQYLECGGRNLFVEELEGGSYSSSDGSKDDNNTNSFRSKNKIRVIPNSTIHTHANSSLSIAGYYLYEYDKDNNFIKRDVSYSNNFTITLSPNCFYISASFYKDNSGWKANVPSKETAQITISLYYTTGDSYDQYFPYEQPKVYDTGTEVLRKAGSVKDYKEPNGTIHRLVGFVDLGTLNWTYDSTYSRWYSDQISSLIKYSVDNNTAGNLLSSLYENVSANLLLGATGMLISVNNGGRISVKNGSSTTQPSGTLNYELATPTTEQGTPFSENIEINDYGTMGWLDTNNAYVNVPQGCKIFYPSDYVLFIDSLGQREDIDFDASEIVSQSELSASETQRDSVDTQLKNAVGGTLRHCLAIQESGLNFEDTDFVDLGSLTWTYLGNNAFSALNVGLEPVANDSVTKALCTKYSVVSYNTLNGNATKICLCGYVGDDRIYVRDTNYTDATTFKNAMKGVLLAYKKASS
ncbi:MAG: hypothetical protein IKA31_04735 [Clostridia bacterium]|nr:hypothetical protein [Clostridia bacterium]